VSQKHDAEHEVSLAVARLKAGILALLFGLFGGIGLFAMTAWLLLKGGPNVGQHLQLLGQYFIGYSVTWPGAFIGMIYGALVGGIIGWSIGTLYNRIVGIRQR
jgi:hypothetical protein